MPVVGSDAANSDTWAVEARRFAHGMRRRVLELTIERNGCYLSQALSAAEILAVLHTRVLRLAALPGPLPAPMFAGVPGPGGAGSPSGRVFHGPRGSQEDAFLVSPAHYAAAVYAALIEAGRLDPTALALFNVDGSALEMIGAEHSPGFELTTGSFAQALSQAGGMAMARRRRGDAGRVVVLMSDGELEEGQTWEAVQALAFYGLDNVIVYVDVNGQQVDGLTSAIMNIEPIGARFEAFGASVAAVDGHDPLALAQPAVSFIPSGRPLVVLCYTNPSQGVPLLDERKPNLHFVRFKDAAEIERYRAFLSTMANAQSVQQ
jgi:transketolase